MALGKWGGAETFLLPPQVGCPTLGWPAPKAACFPGHSTQVSGICLSYHALSSLLPPGAALRASPLDTCRESLRCRLGLRPSELSQLQPSFPGSPAVLRAAGDLSRLRVFDSSLSSL